MKDLMCVPNYTEGEIIINRLFGCAEIHRIYPNLSVSELDKLIIKQDTKTKELIDFLENKGISCDRFKKRKIIKNSVLLKNRKTSISYSGEYIVLRESVIQYLKFMREKVKNKPEWVITDQTYYSQTQYGINSFDIVIKELEELFNYYVRKNNCFSKEEYLEYSVDRLLNTNIILETHQEIRNKKA